MPEWPGLTLALRMPLCCLLWQGSRGSSGSCCAADPGSGSSAAAITVENPAVGRTFRPKLLRSLTVLGDAARDEGPGFKEMEQLISPLHKKRKDEGGGGAWPGRSLALRPQPKNLGGCPSKMLVPSRSHIVEARPESSIDMSQL